MHNFFSFIKEFHFPKKEELDSAMHSFSKGQFLLFSISLMVAIVAIIVMLERINQYFMVDIPARGGTITEGIIGTPSLINPVLALSDADKDLTSIVYSGLMRKSLDGKFVPDLAESYEVSPDGLSYTFTIRKNAKFQDGINITADDIIFTINKIQDPLIKSPRKSGWSGVIVTKKASNVVMFTLTNPYISFMNNTTIGILPEHLWKNINIAEFGLSLLNIKAVGSGPYKIDSVVKNSEGIPTTYNLTRFTGFVLGEPHIENINFVSFANEKDLINALLSHSIDLAFGISPKNAEVLKNNSYNIFTSTPPRMFGLFFNSSNNKILGNKEVIHALNIAINRQAIVDKVLSGYGTVINIPIPSTIIIEAPFKDSIVEEANNILEKAGWIKGADGVRSKGGTPTTTIIKKKVGKNTITQKVVTPSKEPSVRLAFSLITGDTEELKQTSLLLQEQLVKIGMEVNINKVYETGPLNQLIRTRNYESLLFGQVVNNESDLYAFWHSSQINDPGLNIAMYSNKKVDDILSSAQKTLAYEGRISKYKEFINEFSKDTPASLIYSPKYLYVARKDLDNISIGQIVVPSDRFLSIYTWFASKDHVWKIFTK